MDIQLLEEYGKHRRIPVVAQVEPVMVDRIVHRCRVGEGIGRFVHRTSANALDVSDEGEVQRVCAALNTDAVAGIAAVHGERQEYTVFDLGTRESRNGRILLGGCRQGQAGEQATLFFLDPSGNEVCVLPAQEA